MGNLGSEFTAQGVSEYILGNGVDCWVVGFINERDEKIPHLFPKFTLEQRIAEYDLDPDDISGVLEMVLHEPYIPDPSDVRNFDTDAAGKKGLTVASPRGFAQVRRGTQVPIHLMNAPDRATAREAHLARVAEVKNKVKIKSGRGQGILSKGDATDPLQRIVENHGVDPERVKARASYVRWMMAINRGEGDPSAKVRMEKPGGLPVAPLVLPPTEYDSSIRRRGLTVALLDSPQE